MSKKLESPKLIRVRLAVVPAGGGWAVTGNGAGSKSRTFSTKREAETAARAMLSGKRGGEVVIHGRDGRIQSVDSYTLGEAAARSLNAIEGIHISKEMEEVLRDIDRRKLTAKQRRARLLSKYAKT
jgi:hypothetical protein